MKQANGIVRGVLAGAVVCFVMNLMLISIFAWLIAKEYLPEGNMAYVCTGILVFSTLAGSLFSVGKVGEKPLLASLITSAIYYVILISMNALLFDGMYEGGLATGLCIGGSAICATLLKSNQKNNHKRRRKK